MNLFAKTLLTAAIPFLVLSPKEITITRNEVGPEDYPYAIAVGQIDASGAVKSVVEDILNREGVDFTKASKLIACESTWNPEAVNTKNKNGTRDVGLWQINDIHGLSVEDRMDVVKSTEFAVKLYKQYGWTPWVCKTS